MEVAYADNAPAPMRGESRDTACRASPPHQAGIGRGQKSTPDESVRRAGAQGPRNPETDSILSIPPVASGQEGFFEVARVEGP